MKPLNLYGSVRIMHLAVHIAQQQIGRVLQSLDQCAHQHKKNWYSQQTVANCERFTKLGNWGHVTITLNETLGLEIGFLLPSVKIPSIVRFHV